MAAAPLPPLVAHLLFRFDTGGLENGVVNLINHMPRGAYRHLVIALTEVTDFRFRLQRDDVECIALHKGPGHGARLYPRLWRLLRQRRPQVVHTRNLAALEMQVAAWAAGVPVRLHGEHGRDIDDLDGSSRHHQRLRRLYAPFVHRFVVLSQDLQRYLAGPVGIAPGRITQIYNGVDADRFHPAIDAQIPGCPFRRPDHWLVGTVGRMAPVKNQLLLVRAFLRARMLDAGFAAQGRLVLVGDGPLRHQAHALLQDAGAASAAWLPGERDDVPDVMRALDCFVLPSMAEGISNTILESMASGLPVVATAVGGNRELVDDGQTGWLVPEGDDEAMAAALLSLWHDPSRCAAMGVAGRAKIEQSFSLQAMVASYQGLYDRQLASAAPIPKDH